MRTASPWVLVVGETRFIGARVTRRRHAAGAAVTVFHRRQHRHPALPPVRHVIDAGAGYPVCFPGGDRSGEVERLGPQDTDGGSPTDTPRLRRSRTGRVASS